MVWIPLVILVVIACGGYTVARLHGVFGSEKRPSYADTKIDESKPFNPKHVVLDVYGPPGAVATINYLDVNASPQHVDGAALPWSYDTTTTEPAVFLNVVAQGNSDSIGCRISIDGVVKDERTVNTMNAYAYCLDKNG